jgi:cell wall-associated NlpC family hydrolase
VKNNFFFRENFSNVYEKSSQLSKVSTQILYGEKFKILTKKNNWFKIKTSFDNYIGYIKNPKYINNFKPTHKVAKLKSKIFIKLNNKKFNPTKKYLTFASKILVTKEDKKFAQYEKNKWIRKSDIKKIDHLKKNFIEVFKLFLNTKYSWGGKSYMGIDCSAILQIFFYYNHKFYPRDTKKQIKYLRKNKNIKNFKKGDIIFWNGHVAICINSKKLIHAYGPKKKVLIMLINYTIRTIKKTANLVVKKVSNISN